jgi:hypothetical protein
MAGYSRLAGRDMAGYGYTDVAVSGTSQGVNNKGKLLYQYLLSKYLFVYSASHSKNTYFNVIVYEIITLDVGMSIYPTCVNR